MSPSWVYMPKVVIPNFNNILKKIKSTNLTLLLYYLLGFVFGIVSFNLLSFVFITYVVLLFCWMFFFFFVIYNWMFSHKKKRVISFMKKITSIYLYVFDHFSLIIGIILIDAFVFSDWANLPKDLFDSILERLLSSSDYLRFSVVCKPWFGAAKDNQS